MITIYRISPEKAKAEKPRAFKRFAFIITSGVALGFLLGGQSILHESNPVPFIVSILSVALLLTVALWRGLGRLSQTLKDAYSTFEIIADEQSLTKKQKNTPDVTLARSEIRRIEEAQGKGFRICTDERFKNIWVPCELDGYEQLKGEIATLPGITIATTSAAWLKTYLALATFFLLFAVSVLVSDRRVVTGASLLLAGYLLFSFFSHYRNPNLTTRGKRSLLLNAVLALAFLARAAMVWRG